MTITAKQKYDLKKLLKQLSLYRGRHTELVSVYVPAGYDLNKINTHISQEQGTASNIKSKGTRDNVIAALEKMIQHLKLFKQTPPNGLALFSGNVAEREGQEDVQVWSIEPPEPLNQRLYRCDKEFVLEPLADMMETKEIYGLVVLDRRDANIALLRGKRIIPLSKTHSQVPGKMKAGGQCVAPSTLVKTPEGTMLIKEVKIGQQIQSYDFTTKTEIISNVTDKWEVKKEVLYTIKTENSEVICSGDHLLFLPNGTTFTAEECTKDRQLVFKGQNEKILEITKEEKETNLIDISVESGNFIANGLIVHNSAQRFERITEGAALDHYKKVAQYVKENFLGNKELKGIIVGGPGQTKHEFIERGQLTQELKNKIIAVKDLSYTGEFGLQELVDKSQDTLANEEIAKEKTLMNTFFHLLATKPKMVEYGVEQVKKKLGMGAVETVLASEECDDALIEEFEEAALAVGSEVRIISVDTREGVQLRDMGKVAAILRYEVIS